MKTGLDGASLHPRMLMKLLHGSGEALVATC
jgi:hypothetical protein